MKVCLKTEGWRPRKGVSKAMRLEHETMVNERLVGEGKSEREKEGGRRERERERDEPNDPRPKETRYVRS